MATYLILNLVFLAVVLVAIRFKPDRIKKPFVVTLLALIALTALFDNLIISFDIVGYDVTKILNLYIGIAPVEDFFYAILAVILIPIVWDTLGDTHAK